MSEDQHRIKLIYGEETANVAASRQSDGELKADRAWRDSETMKAAAISMGVIAILGTGAKVYRHFHSSHQTPKIEKHGDHHGSTGMAVEKHLKQFAHEHGIKLYGIGTAVEATKVGDGPVKVSRP